MTELVVAIRLFVLASSIAPATDAQQLAAWNAQTLPQQAFYLKQARFVMGLIP